jgi:PAS domain S-box-containing protein
MISTDLARHDANRMESSDFAADLSRLPSSRVGAWLNAVLQSSMDAVAIIDDRQCIVLLNRETERLFEYPSKQLLGKPMDVLLSAGSRTRYRRMIESAASGERLHMEGLRASGSRFRFDASVSCISDAAESFRVLAMRECAPSTLAVRRRAVSYQQAYELEKRRVSRELYDELGQRLSVLKLDMDWLEKSLPATGQLSPARIAQMQSLLDSVIIRTKTIASGLRPPLLDDFGLLAAVRWVAQSFQKRTTIQCDVESNVASLSVGDPVDTAVYRVVQESLLNIERHAHARHVRIEMRREGGDIRVLIQDDGIGIPSGSEYKAGCFGLVAMQERIYTLGGTVDIRSREHQGSAIHVSIPVEPLAHKIQTL